MNARRLPAKQRADLARRAHLAARSSYEWRMVRLEARGRRKCA